MQYEVVTDIFTPKELHLRSKIRFEWFVKHLTNNLLCENTRCIAQFGGGRHGTL